MESKSKKEEVLVVDKDKEKEYDSDLAEAKKRLAMIRYEIFSEKYRPSPIIKKKKQRLENGLNKSLLPLKISTKRQADASDGAWR